MPLQNGETPLSKSFITKVKQKSLLANIWSHDFAERLKMRRVGQAKEDKLGDDYNVGTYPSELLIKKGTGLKGLMAAGLMGAGLLGGGAYLAGLLKTAEIIEKVTTKVIDYEVGMEVIPPVN